jgi:hypothetical protein
MHGRFIGLIFPPQGKRTFFVALKVRSGYRRGEEMFAYLSQLSHDRRPSRSKVPRTPRRPAALRFGPP